MTTDLRQVFKQVEQRIDQAVSDCHDTGIGDAELGIVLVAKGSEMIDGPGRADVLNAALNAIGRRR